MKKITGKIKITNEYPTTIIKDFTIFLEYFEKNKVKLTKANQYLTRKDLVAIYELMSEPKPDVPLKSNQPANPLLHLFFHLAIKMELLKKASLGSGIIATIHEENVADFQSMTKSEQYVSLLECFWTKADWNELQGGYFQQAPSNIDFLFEDLLDFPPNKEILVSKDQNFDDRIYNYEHFLFYLDFFGLWEVVIDKEKSHKHSINHYVAKSITLTPLFKQLQEALIETSDFIYDDMQDAFNSLLDIFGVNIDMKSEEPQKEDNESLFTLLKPLFADGELNKNYLDREKKIIAGTYLFKVLLNNWCWRTLELSESHTLLDLHTLIQEAFDFDDDHLYAFYMDGKRFSRNCYNSPMDSRGPFVHEKKIGELHLYEGQRFLYLFDFGDEWEFYIDVLKITEGKEISRPTIRERKGDSPDQYAW